MREKCAVGGGQCPDFHGRLLRSFEASQVRVYVQREDALVVAACFKL